MSIGGATEKANATEVEVRPTVFVALGGTGMEILLRLRRRILQADWKGTRLNSISEFPVAGFLYFDTDTNEGRETGRAAATDPMAEAVAFQKGETLQTKVDVAFYQRNKQNYPAIAEWLPTRDLSVIDTEKGAGQVRSISRLLFFDQFDVFKNLILKKAGEVMDNVSTQQALSRLGIATQRKLRVVVVGSLAGGTGSGAFIDAGLAISSLTSPKPDAVDLFLMLPSGYAGANRDRVFANGFAALSELEYVMRPNPQPPYVRNWTSVERPLTAKPYSDVFLFDTRNIIRDSTERVDDVYDMIADILFEDFGSSEFARRKRSVAVNQEQHKMRLFHPPIGGEDDHNVLAFSRGYSAIGQSIVATTGSLELEAAVSDATRTMLQAFFGVFDGGSPKLPGAKDRDDFLRARLGLTSRQFDDFPAFLRPRPAAVPAYQLVDQLLVGEDTKSIHGRLVEDLASEVRRLREQASEPKDWATQGERIRARYEAEVLARAGSASIRRGEIDAARARILHGLVAEEGSNSLRQALYDLVDDRQNGGLDFTMSLVEQVRDELARDGTGIRAQLEQAAVSFRATADDIMSRHLVASLQKLERAARPNLLGRVDRAAAEEYLRQFESDLADGLKFWLRATAAVEAQRLLDEVAAHLGERSSPDEAGEVTWTGLLRELDEGRRSVRAAMTMVSAEADRVRDAANRPDGGVYVVIGRGDGRVAEERVATEPFAWAAEKFADFGGCRRMFGLLRNDADRLRLINQLRSIAKDKLADEERRIPSVVDVLRGMTPDDRRRTIERMLARAMPWVPAQFDNFHVGQDQFKLLLATPDAGRFGEDFGAAVSSAMPFPMGPPSIVESGVRGRLICYCELSGFPLDVLAPLRDAWRKSYDKEITARDPLPLHNHQDYLRFPLPLVPSPDELLHQRELLALFLRAAMYGLLRRGVYASSDGQDDPRYYVDMSRHDFQSIGTERKVRLKGFEANHLARIRQLVDDFEAARSPWQWAGLSALARWDARRGYAPPRERDAAGNDSRPTGLGFQVCSALADEFARRAAADGAAETDADAIDRLYEAVEEFTVAIASSLGDVEHSEANRDPDDAPDMRATDKRAVDPKRFDDATLRSAAGPVAAVGPTGPSSGAVRPGPPPPPPASSFYVVADGSTTGPFDMDRLDDMRRQGALSEATMVYDADGGDRWLRAGDEPLLAALFQKAVAGRRPPPPPPSD